MLQAGGITSAKGFLACGDHVGFKKRRKDMALVWSLTPATAAGVFTTNKAKAAPVLWSESIVHAGKTVRGMLVNSGQANACTGAEGASNAKSMAQTYARCMSVETDEILLASTGLIGVQIPMPAATRGIEKLSGQLSADEFSAACAAEAIMTRDTCVKQACVQFEIDGKTITIGAMAKGSGMVHPNMATTLSFITTDAAISKELLQKALSLSVDETYNMISVDGDTSTNDMVLFLANGMAGNATIENEDEDFEKFCAALNELNKFLAKKIAADGEGSTKVATVKVLHAPDLTSARVLARKVVSSTLVKTALFAADPNWGRILAALGSAGVQFEVNNLTLAYKTALGTLTVLEHGHVLDFDQATARDILAADDIEIVVDLDAGSAKATAWGCDLSEDFVRKNSLYSPPPAMPIPTLSEVG